MSSIPLIQLARRITDNLSYDGEDAEPEAPAPAAAAVKTEPDSTVTAPTSAAETAAPQPEDDEPKPFDPAAEDMDVKQEFPIDTGFGGYNAPEPDRGPVHLKDDG